MPSAPPATPTTAVLLCLAIIAGWPSAAFAQDYLSYPSVRFPFEEGNGGVDYLEFYKRISIQSGVARESLPHLLDQSFGADPKQRLDLFMPGKAPSKAPVFLFIHGGAFEEGDRAHYGYVAVPLAAHGIITAVTSYRLAGREPDNKTHYGEQEDDIKSAIVWLYRNVARFGGDPNRLYIGGHSAGGLLAANLGVDRNWLGDAGVPRSVIRGVAAVSGGFVEHPPWLAPRVVPTPVLQKRADPFDHIGDPAPRFVLARGERETGIDWAAGVHAMQAALQAKGVDVSVVVEPQADHGGAVIALGDERSVEMQAILRMIAASN